jgi:hypothetical protein
LIDAGIALAHAMPAPCVSPYHLSTMLEAIAVSLIVLWLLGLFTSYTLGGLIHVLLVIAVIAILLRFIGGRRI